MFLKNYSINFLNKLNKTTLRKPFLATTKTTFFYLKKLQKRKVNLLFRLKNKVYSSKFTNFGLKKKDIFFKDFIKIKNKIYYNNNLFIKNSIPLTNLKFKSRIFNFFFDYFDYVQKRKLKRIKYRTKIFQATVYLKQTSNNFFITVMRQGKMWFWLSSGLSGFAGPKRSTPFAAEVTTKKLISKLKDLKIKYIKLVLQSPFNYFIDSSLKIFKDTQFIKIKRLTSNVPKSHNGIRRSKKRSL